MAMARLATFWRGGIALNTGRAAAAKVIPPFKEGLRHPMSSMCLWPGLDPLLKQVQTAAFQV
jgi:hypothetical protein